MGMTRVEAFDILGLSENASPTMVRVAFKTKRKQATTPFESEIYAEAYHVLTGTRPAEDEPSAPMPAPAPRPSSAPPRSAPTAQGHSREVRVQSREVARQASTPIDHFDRSYEIPTQHPLPESAFLDLPELRPSRSYEAYTERSGWLSKVPRGQRSAGIDLAIDPSGTSFLLATEGWPFKWHIASAKAERALEAHEISDTYGCDISSDGTLAVTCAYDGNTIVWDYSTCQPLYKRGNLSTCTVRFSPDNQVVAGATGSGEIFLWNYGNDSFSFVKERDRHWSNIHASIQFIGSRNIILVFWSNNILEAWDLNKGTRIFESDEKYSGHYTNLDISSDEKIGISSCTHVATWWDLESFRPLLEYRKIFSRDIMNAAVAISPDGRRCLTSSANELILWDLPNFTPLNRLVGHTRRVSAAKFGPDSTFAISTSEDATAKLWRF